MALCSKNTIGTKIGSTQLHVFTACGGNSKNLNMTLTLCLACPVGMAIENITQMMHHANFESNAPNEPKTLLATTGPNVSGVVWWNVV